MTSGAINPNDLYETLAMNATTRTRKSLEILQQICQEQNERGSPDFSIPTIGRLSAARGGPGEQSIRNKTGEHYRALLAAWAAFTEGSTKKPQQKPAPLTEEAVLPRIEDPAIRAVVAMILSTNKRLVSENQLLKQNAEVVIDRRREPVSRPVPTPLVTSNRTVVVEVPPSSVGLSKTQIEALEHAISPELMENQGWEAKDNGRVSKGVRPIYKPGYVDAIKTILAAEKQAGKPSTPGRDG